MRKYKKLFVLFIFCCLQSSIVFARDSPALCVQQDIAAAKRDGAVQGIAPSEGKILVTEVANSIALNQSITVISCASYVEKVIAWSSQNNDLKDVPLGEYILYNPDWFREVIGPDKVQAIAIFGHELGHFFNRHFGDRKNLSNVDKETEADDFAGCAVARLSGEFASLENLLSRIRRDKDDNYPNRLQSIEAAKTGFERCSRGPAPSPSTLKKAALQVAAAPDTVGIKIGGYYPVDYVFKELSGVSVQVESEDSQWLQLDGTPASELERGNRILGGSFPIEPRESGIYHNNIYLPPEIAAAARAKGKSIVNLRHVFNCRDANGRVIQIPAILRVQIQ